MKMPLPLINNGHTALQPIWSNKSINSQYADLEDEKNLLLFVLLDNLQIK